MTIQSLNNRANSLVLPSKSPENGKAKNTDSTPVEKPVDDLAMTAAAKEITKAFESSPTIDKSRVEAIKTALDNGSYQIDATKIAGKMIQMEDNQFNSR